MSVRFRPQVLIAGGMAPADPHKVGRSGSIPGPATSGPVVQRQRPPAYNRATMVRVHPGLLQSIRVSSFRFPNSKNLKRGTRNWFSGDKCYGSTRALGARGGSSTLPSPTRPRADVARPQQGACPLSRIMRVRPPPSALHSAELEVRNAELRRDSNLQFRIPHSN